MQNTQSASAIFCPDFIFFHRHTKGLVPVRVLETLPINILRSAGLPNEVLLIFKCKFDLSLSVEIKQSVVQLV